MKALALLGCLAAVIVCGCSPSMIGEGAGLRSATFEIGGGEPGAGFVKIEVLDDGRLVYRRVPDYDGDWNVKPVERALTLDPGQVALILRRLRTLRLDRLKSEKIECCDQIVSQFSARTGTESIVVQLAGMPCRLARPKKWLSAWTEVCPLLALAEPEYWKSRGCPCGARALHLPG
jgi:hypothetical protein